MAGDTFANRLLVTRSKVITREEEIASVEALISAPIPDDNRLGSYSTTKSLGVNTLTCDSSYLTGQTVSEVVETLTFPIADSRCSSTERVLSTQSRHSQLAKYWYGW